jgi:hypothetical protein
MVNILCQRIIDRFHCEKLSEIGAALFIFL